MRHRGPESEYLRHIDEYPERTTGQGYAAEEAVMNFFHGKLEGFDARGATSVEDSGHRGLGVGSKMIDTVVYERGPKQEFRPSFVLQVTTNSDQVSQKKKLTEMQDFPFVRLPEMKHEDPALPRALVYVDAKAIQDFMQDKQFENHPGLALQILDSVIKSLQYDLGRTKLGSEQEHIKHIIAALEAEWVKWGGETRKAA